MGNVCASICGGSGYSKPKPAAAEEINYGYTNINYGFEPESTPAPAPAPAPAPPEPEVPKAPPKPAPTTPIVLETLQGDWVNSMGAKIKVDGMAVSLNGIPLNAHPLTFYEDDSVKSIGKIWQLKGWLEDEKIEWKEAPSLEVAEFARSVVWTKATDERMEEWNQQMKGLGYSGSSSAPLSRGIEGCCPGTSDAAAKVQVENTADQDKEELALLNRLVCEYRLPGLRKVAPRLVIPDFSNRGHTGLSVEHVHYLAKSFREKGFIERHGNKGHDIPVLVEEGTSSDLGKKSIANWRSKLADEPGFPPLEHYEKTFRGSQMYTSLGNGHFNQALNLFLCECKDIYGENRYLVGNDHKLKEAVEVGVDAIVLRNAIPLRDRETISKLLNSKREYKWQVAEDGSIDILDAKEDTHQVKQFEAMSKVLDAVELNCLVRAELNIKDSHRIGQ
jgi:hypothetical protein